MDTEIIQVRDVPAEDVQILRKRAAAQNMSVSSYLRKLIHADTSQPAMPEVIARIATRSSIEASSANIREFIESDRQP